MKAIEITSQTDTEGILKIDIPLLQKNKKVRVLILLEENETEDDKLWLYNLSKNPSFDFLNEPDEDIYSLNDGEKICHVQE
ncbi:MAG: hypothetical protein ACK5HT_09520 [Draconibacterium sp.]